MTSTRELIQKWLNDADDCKSITARTIFKKCASQLEASLTAPVDAKVVAWYLDCVSPEAPWAPYRSVTFNPDDVTELHKPLYSAPTLVVDKAMEDRAPVAVTNGMVLVACRAHCPGAAVISRTDMIFMRAALQAAIGAK